MSEVTTPNINEKDQELQRATNTENQGNDGFPAFSIVFLLAFIWILTNFTVFVCTVLIILMAKVARTTNSTDTANNNRTNTPSTPLVCVNCSRRMVDAATFESLSTTYDRATINIEELETEHDRGVGSKDMLPTRIEQQNSGGPFGIQDAPPGDLANTLSQMSESAVDQIDTLIVGNGTVAISITSSVDGSTSTTNTVQPPADATVSATSSSVTSTITPTIRKSAFVTENVMKIAVSYSSKERKRVLKITRILKDRITTDECPRPIFFDKDFQHEVCRLHGLNHLLSIYRQAQMVIVFLSPSYSDSRYCTGEWRTITQRFLTNRKNKEATQLLLVKLGQYDMEQLELVDSDFALNGERMSNNEIAELILRRWAILEENLEHSDE